MNLFDLAGGRRCLLAGPAAPRRAQFAAERRCGGGGRPHRPSTITLGEARNAHIESLQTCQFSTFSLSLFLPQGRMADVRRPGRYSAAFGPRLGLPIASDRCCQRSDSPSGDDGYYCHAVWSVPILRGCCSRGRNRKKQARSRLAAYLGRCPVFSLHPLSPACMCLSV